MYKKITHSIFEEQFSHPDIVRAVPARETDVKSKMVDSSIANVLRRQVREIVVHYNGRMRDTIVSIADGSGNQTIGVEFITKEIINLSKIIARYYSPAVYNTFSTELTAISTNTITLAAAIKDGIELPLVATANANSIENFAQNTAFGTGAWSTVEISDIFTEITNNWLNQVRARMSSNWEQDFNLINKNEVYLVSGDSMIISYADAISAAIIFNFPTQF